MPEFNFKAKKTMSNDNYLCGSTNDADYDKDFESTEKSNKIALSLGLGTLYFMFAALIGLGGLKTYENHSEVKFNKKFERVLKRDADSNKDGVISPLEEIAFGNNLLNSKGATYELGIRPHYKNSINPVPYIKLNAWMNEYIKKTK